MKTESFWNKEYKDPKHLAISTEPSGDLLEFVVWANRNAEWPAFPKHGTVLDIGCGNGRNLVPLCLEYNMNGIGTEISEVALSQAKQHASSMRGQALAEGRKLSPTLKMDLIKQSAGEILDIPDQSIDVALDMMVSHQLVKKEREQLVRELARVVKPYGWVFFKTFLKDSDQNALRMIQEFHITKDMVRKDPTLGDEKGNPEFNSYIHPHTKGFEHVFTEDEIIDLYSPFFKIHKMKKSYKHVRDGKAWKRRTISVYLERLRD